MPDPTDPGRFQTKNVPMPGKATETVSIRSTAPATVAWVGPYGHIPLSQTGEEHAGGTSVSIQRSSNVHANNAVDGCNSGDPSLPPDPVPTDCGSRQRNSAFGVAVVGLPRKDSSRVSVVTPFLVPVAYEACVLPGGVGLLDKLQSKAEAAAARTTGPRVARLFSGSPRIVERGTATVRTAGIQPGSIGTYTLTVNVVLVRSHLVHARFG